jgi:hypothetical protein
VSSFEYLFVNGVPRWGSGGLRMAFLMLQQAVPCIKCSFN